MLRNKNQYSLFYLLAQLACAVLADIAINVLVSSYSYLGLLLTFTSRMAISPLVGSNPDLKIIS